MRCNSVVCFHRRDSSRLDSGAVTGNCPPLPVVRYQFALPASWLWWSLCLLSLLLIASVCEAQFSKEVQNLQVQSLTPGELKIEWMAPETSPVDYWVNWGLADEAFPTWRAATGNDYPANSTVTLNDLEPGLEYQVRVQARYGSGQQPGPFSAAVVQRVDDYHEDADTEGAIDVEGSSDGEIDSAGDVDWLAVTLEGGQLYEVTVSGDEGLGAQLIGVYDDFESEVRAGVVWSGTAALFFTPALAGAYYVSVAGTDEATGGYTATVAEAPEGMITGLSLASNNPGELVITWNEPSPVPTDYRVIWAKSDEKFRSYRQTEGNAYPTAASYSLTGLEQGAAYKVRVRARYFNDSGRRQRSGPWTAPQTMVVASGPAVPALLKPTNLRVEVVDGAMTLSWDPPAHDPEGVTGYGIRRQVPEHFVVELRSMRTLVDNTNSRYTSYTDRSADVNRMLYVYCVQAWWGTFKSPCSSSADFRSRLGTLEPALVDRPPPPTGLSARVVAGKVRLRWDPSLLTEYHTYYVWREALDQPVRVFGRPIHALVSKPRFTDRDVESGQRYRYGISVASQPHYHSLASEPVTVTIPPAPTGTAELRGLDLPELPPLSFDPGQQRYQLELDEPPAQTTVTVFRQQKGAGEVEIFSLRSDGPLRFETADADPDTKGHQALISQRADSLILVVNRSPDGLKERAYTLRLRPRRDTYSVPSVSRALSSARQAEPAMAPRLSALSLSTGTLEPAFSPTVFTYETAVVHDVAQLTVSASAAAGGSVLIVPGDADAGTAGHQVALNASPIPDGEPAETTISVIARSADAMQLEAYIVTVSRAAPPSNDAALASLSLDGFALVPAFDAGITSYSATVGEDDDTVTVSAAANHAAATVTISPADADDTVDGWQASLAAGDNVVIVTVTAADGVTIESYTITISRPAPASDDATLASLSVDGATLSEAFDANVNSYQVDVGWQTEQVTLRLQANDVQVHPVVSPDDADATRVGHQIDLPDLVPGGGPQTVHVAVVLTATDGVTRRTYLLTIVRAAPSDDATLRSLSLANVSLSPAFEPSTVAYTAAVGQYDGSVTISAQAGHPSAGIAFSHDDANTAAEGHQVNLSVGDNVISVTVTAEDGLSTGTYTLTVTRAGVPPDPSLTRIDTSITMELPEECQLYDLGAAFKIKKSSYSRWKGYFSTPWRSWPRWGRKCDSLYSPYMGRKAHYYRLIMLEEGEIRLVGRSGTSTRLIVRSADGEIVDSDLGPTWPFIYTPQLTLTLPAGVYVVEHTVFREYELKAALAYLGENIYLPLKYALRDLEITDVNMHGFDRNTYSYRRNIAADVTTVTVTPVATHGDAIIDIIPADADETMEGHQVAVSPGDTVVEISVRRPTSPGIKNTYTVTLTSLPVR